jgi:hypothetical protein
MGEDKDQIKALAELMEKMRGKGVDMGTWTETEEHQAEHPMLKNQKTMWVKMRGLLEEQVKKDQEKVVELQELVDRLKHGGGR